MKPQIPIAAACIAGAAACLLMSQRAGEDALHVLLFIPVISVNGIWSGLGALLLVAGVFLLFLSMASGHGWEAGSDTAGTRTESSGFILIGPVPIVWSGGSREGWRLALLGAALTAAAAGLFLYLAFA